MQEGSQTKNTQADGTTCDACNGDIQMIVVMQINYEVWQLHIVPAGEYKLSQMLLSFFF